MRKTTVSLHVYPDVGANVKAVLPAAAAAVRTLFDQETQGKFSVDLVPGQDMTRADSFQVRDDDLGSDLQGLPAPAPSNAWFTRLLVAQSSIRINPTRPLGVIFDQDRRSGCAVFVSTIGKQSLPFSDLLVRTMAHELGHVFNLAHEDGAGNDIMFGDFPTLNQVQNPIIAPGNASHLVDHDEDSVRPGRRRFLDRACLGHPNVAFTIGNDQAASATAVAEASPLKPRSSKVVLRLRIHHGMVYPRTSHPTFVIGEPLHITVELYNGSRRVVFVPRGCDTATQNLVLQRIGPDGIATLLPPLLYCACTSRKDWQRLEPGRRAVFHETLLFRNNELVFPREGGYQLTAGLRLRGGWLVSEARTVRVAPPLEKRHERACEAAADPGAGLFVELGGAALGRAYERLRRLDRSNPKFPLNHQFRLLAGRQAVIAPTPTPASSRAQLIRLKEKSTAPRTLRAEAELLLLLDHVQEGDHQAAVLLRRRLADPLRLPISIYAATLIRRRLDDLHPPQNSEEPS